MVALLVLCVCVRVHFRRRCHSRKLLESDITAKKPSCGQNNSGVAQHHKQSSQKIKERKEMEVGKACAGGQRQQRDRGTQRDYGLRLPAEIIYACHCEPPQHANLQRWGTSLLVCSRRDFFYSCHYRCPSLRHAHKHCGAEPPQHPRQAKLWLQLLGLQTATMEDVGRVVDWFERQEMN